MENAQAVSRVRLSPSGLRAFLNSLLFYQTHTHTRAHIHRRKYNREIEINEKPSESNKCGKWRIEKEKAKSKLNPSSPLNFEEVEPYSKLACDETEENHGNKDFCAVYIYQGMPRGYIPEALYYSAVTRDR